MHADLQGKVAIVTGGGRDIGRAVSLKLAECGAAVVVNYHASAERATEVVEEITKRGGRAIAVRADVSQPDEVRRLIDTARKTFGDRIDIVVNNAGGLIARKALADLDAGFFDAVMDLNVKSVMLVTQAAAPYLAEGGAVVNLSSLAAYDGGGPGSLLYAAAKGAVLTMTRGLSKELAPRKVRANCVAPGMIDTTFHDTFTRPEARQATVARTTVGREGTPEDVANAVLFLASDASAYINGESIAINGGLYYA
jgi:3-oxoacyl-[acyl-carrier protein] reductase